MVGTVRQVIGLTEHGDVVFAEQRSERAVYSSPFAIKDKVIFDDDRSIVMSVTAVLWRVEAPQVEVSWMHNGALVTAWVSPSMLSLAERP